MKSSQAPSAGTVREESPTHVRLSLAAAMTLGFTPGWFYRNARLGCINLLLTYDSGCRANCAFCGLAAEKNQDITAGRFIRVPWKTFHLDDVIDRIRTAPDYVGRVCVSMITHPRCKADVLTVCGRVHRETGKSVSLLIAPTLLDRDDLCAMKEAGADRIGVAIDAATPEIFSRLRGKPVHGPHRWEKYWEIYRQSLEVFGPGMAGVHLICGLGETEQELAHTISHARELGGFTHLFSFFPERGSLMQDHTPPLMGTYRRIQLARWLVDTDRTRSNRMVFDDMGHIRDFGVPEHEIEHALIHGEAFQTSGCPGPDGKVACNRPFGNEKPGPHIRNFPFPPDEEDLKNIRRELSQYDEPKHVIRQ
jgi:lipoyl synthase